MSSTHEKNDVNDVDTGGDPDLSQAMGWRAAEGLQDLGPVQDSGLSSPTYLVRRRDGQVVQLSELLYLVLRGLHPNRSATRIADAVTEAYSRQLTTDGLMHLVTKRLQPLGLADVAPTGDAFTGDPGEPLGASRGADRRALPGEGERAAGASGSGSGKGATVGALPGAEAQQLAPKHPPKAVPLLSLSLRGVIVPERAVPVVAKLLAPLFWPPVVIVALAAVVALDIQLVMNADLANSFTTLLTTPTTMLALFVILTCGGLIHEMGHAAACAYGGGKPGAIGFGVYLLFPAFYTDVTDSYRLNRAGRLRTDLGGLYFNVLTLIPLGALSLATDEPAWLIAVVLMHIEMVQQLVPAVRLDGYYILSDLAGVPDLFARVGPVLRSVRPGAITDPRVAELRPAARRIVIAWVAFVVPTLTAGILWLLWNLPFIVRTNLKAIGVQADLWAAARGGGDLVMVAIASISILLLAVPLLGLSVLLYRLIRTLARLVARPATLRLTRSRRSHSHGPLPTPEVQMDPDTATDTPPTTERDTPDRGAPDRGAAAANGAKVKATSNGQANRKANSKANGKAQAEVTYPRDFSDDEAPDVSTEVPTLNADAFRDDLILPSVAPVPSTGWRRAVYVVSGGSVNPGLSPAEQRELDIESRLRAPIRGSRRIVVMSRKGGVGKTTMTFALGSTFAGLRGDRVIAVDANPDAGNLAHRVAEPNERSITDVLRDRESISSYAQLREYTAQADESRLEVLASDDDPKIGMALGRDDYHDLIDLLDRFYNLIVLDTGTGILDSANQGLLSDADQLVLVLRAGVDGGRAAALTLDWLDQHENSTLVANAVVVINAVRKGVGAPIEPIVDHFSRRCRRVVTIPWDPALEVGAQTHLSALRPITRNSIVEMAAAVSDGFAHHEGTAR
ncbi:hypothetical protein N802_04205 [Knoellia sinensis KCTC 19936]|uniref:CobQ/CobB/MinD/ParA nucleotide binding domain-containing protein n=1 Tax=Knoellia sinensis KCTC 19936 TaxID=1385520 RepID=A0A0A0J5C3_9MICO|nr:MinD/ParA family protein [Knoellia sinensis]KGN31297.1 hypothetical protein N802_04205 [Knoellia sinensis KCTC 19936]